jgi:cell division protein FtsB
MALAGIHLYIYTQNINLKYKVTDLKIKLAEVRSKNRELGSQIAQKENLSYIEKVAKEKLNMIYPAKINYVLPSSKAPEKSTP